MMLLASRRTSQSEPEDLTCEAGGPGWAVSGPARILQTVPVQGVPASSGWERLQRWVWRAGSARENNVPSQRREARRPAGRSAGRHRGWREEGPRGHQWSRWESAPLAVGEEGRRRVLWRQAVRSGRSAVGWTESAAGEAPVRRERLEGVAAPWPGAGRGRCWVFAVAGRKAWRARENAGCDGTPAAPWGAWAGPRRSCRFVPGVCSRPPGQAQTQRLGRVAEPWRGWR